MILGFRGFVNQIAGHCSQDNSAQHQQGDTETEGHQNAFPRKGSIRPQYKTPSTRTNAETATALAVRGALSPAPRSHGSSSTVKYRTFNPVSIISASFHLKTVLLVYCCGAPTKKSMPVMVFNPKPKIPQGSMRCRA